jgi:hypothetical protein
MANLTIAVHAETLRKARLRAMREGSTVNNLLREFLESYVDNRSRQIPAVRNLIALAKKNEVGTCRQALDARRAA